MSARRRTAAAVACAALAGAALAGAGVVGASYGRHAAAGPSPPVLRVAVATGGLVPEIASGVATGDGRVLTVAHVLAGGGAVTVAGRRARVLRVDRRLDLALLAVPRVHAPAVRLAAEGAGIAIAVVRDGRARTLRGRVRRRVTVRWREQPGDAPRTRPGLELAATVQPGDSGAPVLDGRGGVLGVVYARTADADGTAWAVDAAAVRAFLTTS